MDLSYTLGKAHINHNIPTLSKLYWDTLLSRNPHPLFLSTDDVYDITHVIFYLSDFGFKNIRAIDGHRVAEIQWIISTLVALYLQVRNWDILAELLISCHCLQFYPRPLYEVAWASLLSSQRSDGSFSGPLFIENNLEGMNFLQSRQHIFSHNYHTTLVTAMAIILTYSRGHKASRIPSFEKDVMSQSQFEISYNRAYYWIRKAFDSDKYEFDLTSLLNILLGSWIYYNTVKAQNFTHLLSYAEKIRTEIDNWLIIQEEIPVHTNAVLLLMGACILRKLGLSNATLERLIKHAYSTMQKHVQSTRHEVISYQSRFLLRKLGLTDHKDIPYVKKPTMPCDINELYAYNRTWEYLSSYISARSSFGRKRVKFNSKLQSHIHSSITSFLLHSLYNYDLDTGLDLMRTMIYLGMQNAMIFKQALEFVIKQQRLEGCIGFFAPEVEKLHKNNIAFNEMLDLHLPTTVSFLHTMAETMYPNFSLFHSV
jgi:hypothetical protein